MSTACIDIQNNGGTEYEDTAEDLLINLKQEMDRIYPWACPHRVKVLLAKIAYKVHKEKVPGKGRVCLLWRYGGYIAQCLLRAL